MHDMTTYYGKTKIKNPLIMAAAGTTGNLDLIKRAEESGVAAVVMKTLFEEEYSRQNPTPCFKVIRRKAGPMSSTTFYSFEQASPWGLGRYAEEIYRAKQETGIPVIASINCINDNTWVKYAQSLEEAGASAVELNRSCPYSKVLLSGQDSWTSLAAETIKLVKEAVSIPVSVKFTPQLADPMISAKQLEEAGVDGLVMFSRFTGLEIDVETEKPVMHGGFAGHGGTWALHYALRWIVATSPEVNIPISASGGVSSGDDIIKFILAGAGSVQICTVVYMQGFKIIKNYLDRLKEYIEEKGYSSLEDFKGKVCSRVVSSDQVDRSKRFVALIDADKCNGCDTCDRVCLYRAVNRENGIYSINPNCAGCGLCEQLCLERAIAMVGV